MVEYTKETKFNNFIKGFSAIILYFSLSFFKTMPLDILHIDYESLGTLIKELYNISIEILMLGIIFVMFEQQFKNAWLDLRKNHLKYFSENFKYYLLGLLLMMGSNFLINMLGGGLSGNESLVREQFQTAPIFTYISGVFLAPLLEESIFRLSFRNMIQNKIIFILVSGLVFGGLHLLAGVEINLIFLHLIPYSSFGIIFAYMFVKTNNIFVSMGFHLMHNGILMSIQMLLFLLG